MNPIRHAAWLLLAHGALAGAQTQAQAQAPSQTLPPVTSSVTRLEAPPFDVPASVDVIDGGRLRAAGRPEIQLSESLATVPGLTARDRQNFAQDLQLSIRGFGARSTFGVRGVRLYVDGIPATMPDGQGQLSHFDLASAGHVEVLRGPFSALHGNSSGGVLELFTERGQGPAKVSATGIVGSDGLRRGGVRASGSQGRLGYSVSVNHMELDGWRDHSAADRDLGNVRLDWDAGEGSQWMLTGNVLDLKADDPLGLTRQQFESNPRGVDPAALTFNTRKTVRQSQVGLVHEREIDASNRLRLMVYTGERTTVQFQSIPVATQGSPLHPGGVIDLERGYGGADLRWTWRRGESLEVVTGLAYDRLEEDRRGFLNFAGPVLGVQGDLRRAEDNTVTNLDPYVQASWKPAADWRVTAGLRRSNVRFESRDRFIAGPNRDDSGSVRYDAWLPAAGVMYEVSPSLHAYAAAGRGYETPTFNELAYRPDGTAGLNFALQPSRSRNVEVGLKGRGALGEGRMEWSGAVFQTDTRNEIVTQTNSGGRSTFRNAGETRRRGLELAWNTVQFKALNLYLAQTWLDAQYSTGFRTCVATPCATPTLAIPAGNRIPGTARAFTAAELHWLPPQGWRWGAEWRRSGRVFVNDANTDAAGSWNTTAAYVGYLFATGPWTFETTARVDNLFDRTYAGSVIVNEGNGRFFEPAPGRQYLVKLTVGRTF